MHVYRIVIPTILRSPLKASQQFFVLFLHFSWSFRVFFLSLPQLLLNFKHRILKITKNIDDYE